MAKTAAVIYLSLFILLSLSFPLLTSSVRTKAISLNEKSAYRELKNKGFPYGLLPANVESYTFNETSGEFSVTLGDTCRLTLPPDNYQATYSRRITGRLTEGKIGGLDGISVWAIFRWWSITGISSSGDDLVFEVGMITAKFASKNFDESPVCEGLEESATR